MYDSKDDYESWLGEYNEETEVLNDSSLEEFVMTKKQQWQYWIKMW